MSTYLCRADELQPGQVRRCKVGRRNLVVVCTLSKEYYALGASCPHQGADMAAGVLEKRTVSDTPGEYRTTEPMVLRCPWHSFDFDVTTGYCVADDSLRVSAHPVVVKGGEVHLGRQ
jgi:nitrite reductase/ring-hydroxylating ferredoxin subunit